jgi:hypothetical protein
MVLALLVIELLLAGRLYGAAPDEADQSTRQMRVVR